MGFITRERAALQSTHPTQNVKLIIRYYLDVIWLYGSLARNNATANSDKEKGRKDYVKAAKIGQPLVRK